MDQQSDQALMEAAAVGNATAFAEIVRRYAGPIHVIVSRVLGDAHRAEDVVQDALLQAWRKASTFDRPRPLRPWLFQIAMNRCREMLRQPLPSPMGDEEPPGRDAGDGLSNVIGGETSGLVLAAVDRLTPMQRAVVLLRIWEHLPYGEIANTLGTTETTARSHMHHALASLRSHLRRLA